MTDVVESLRHELRLNTDGATRQSAGRYFKEAVHLYGVKTTTVNALAKKYLREIRPLHKDEVFRLCERLWQSGLLEESFVACNWSYAMRTQYEPADIAVFEHWVDSYVTNWAACDTLCNHTVGALVDRYPEQVEALKRWAVSPNRWMRRAAAVSIIIPARRGKFLQDVFAIACILLEDKDDLVQKGYGWMLKAAAETHQAGVFDFVMKTKAAMPRTALRYAIEKMPADMKSAAMRR